MIDRRSALATIGVMIDSDDSSGSQSSKEQSIYAQMHVEEDDVSSGYSTISSGKEEGNLTRHLANAAASKAAARSMQQQKQDKE